MDAKKAVAPRVAEREPLPRVRGNEMFPRLNAMQSGDGDGLNISRRFNLRGGFIGRMLPSMGGSGDSEGSSGSSGSSVSGGSGGSGGSGSSSGGSSTFG